MYLLGKVSAKTANNILNYFNRILKYHERNGFISKLPYQAGAGNIRKTSEDKAKTRENQAQILPVQLLKNIVSYTPNEKEKETYLIAMVGLITGIRNSELAEIRKEDITYLGSRDIYILKVYNNKNRSFHENETDEYKKFPLHPFVAKRLKNFALNSRPGEPIFSIPLDAKGYPITRGFRKAISLFYSAITKKLNDDDLSKEMKKEGISFYSFRHTLNTLFQLHLNIEKNDLIDYFTGHKLGNKMRENYSHINKVDNETFYDNYGKVLLETLDKFIFKPEQ